MNITVNQLKEKGFTRDQIQEIMEGISAGLPVEWYAHKHFLAIQMRQIRLGILMGLPVEWYAKPEYDWLQMEEIRKGLNAGVDVSLFASPEISFDRMQQMRLGLEDGIDLSTFKKLDAGILKQLRLAYLDRVKIVPYILEGYDTEQLEVIREALKKNLEIKPWVSKVYRGVALQEIFLGLESGCDVSVYATTKYNWRQMREIRLGIAHRVDICLYSNEFYSYLQMQEIRLGLEAGIDVSFYRSLMYTAAQMRQRRLLLDENPMAFVSKVITDSNLPTGPEEEDKQSNGESLYTVELSADEMEVYLTVSGSKEDFSRIGILKALRRMGICYGIQYQLIDEIVSGNSPRKNLLIAKGQQRTDGRDGWYELFFRTDLTGIPKMLESGKVDYREVRCFEIVEKGQKLAVYHRAEKGEDGITVTGKVIPARNGREKGHLVGSGFQKLQDGVTYISALHGIVTMHDCQLNVSKVLVMKEVNLATGNVDYDGSVVVTGNVSSGSSIRAGADVIVEGYVEDAQICCGGDVFLRHGMNGGGRGIVRANGNVMGYFFESTEIHAGGNIQGDYFFKCSLSARGEVLAMGKKGTIAGGITVAESGLKAKNLGNAAGLPTTVVLGRRKQLMKEKEQIQNSIQEAEKELQFLKNAQKEFQKRYSLEIRNTMDIYIKVESAIYTKERELEKFAQDLVCLELEFQKSGCTSATVEKLIYHGVTVEIDGASWNAKELEGVVIKKSAKAIAVYSI